MAPKANGDAPDTAPIPRLRPWQRLGVRLAALFALVTVLAVALVGAVVYDRQKREVADAVGTQLLNIARISVLLIDPALHARAEATLGEDSEARRRLTETLAAIRTEAVLPTPISTLAVGPNLEARVVVTSGDGGRPGAPYPLAREVRQPLAWTLEDGVARYTGIYRNGGGRWISAFAPIAAKAGPTRTVLTVDYPVEIYLDRLRELQIAIVQASVAGALVAVLLGLLVARRITRPISALTRGAARVGAGDLSQAVPVVSRDEVGQLTRAFNGMIEGLRQRDFIRNTFGRYVSPEVARALLESPEGLKLGGEKRVVTVLMSDLRGYTRFAEQGDPAWVMDVLNGYLARMADIIIGYGGTINEFIGDAIFAVFGAPIAHADHAERAAAAALAMQRAMGEINAGHGARGLPRFAMGIGVNTGEAVVGNIGSEQRAKYAVVGSAVNVAARIESATVGGQVFVSASTYERIETLAEAAPPLSVEVKGLSAPLLLYELRGLEGRFAQRLPETGEDEAGRLDVLFPAVCSVIEGKAIRKETIRGVVVGLGRRRLGVRLETVLTPLTNVRLRLTYPGLGFDSGDLYGKVVGREERAGGAVTLIALTSVDDADQRVIDMVLEEAPGTE